MSEIPIIDTVERIQAEHHWLEKMRRLSPEDPWVKEEIRTYEEQCRR